MMSRRNDKRDRLINAADALFHQQGISVTTLANIATLANVPLGNVYYYFKSKDSIILAVIERRMKILSNMFAEWSDFDAKSRLKALVDNALNSGEEAAKFGDALGSLCQELGKHGGEISQAASQLMHKLISWSAEQFKALGRQEDEANKLALNLVSSLQGINLITLSFKDENFLQRQTQFLKDWLEGY
jgi:TetR/AcrR family transcriptional repressor of nem operon